ncbi:MAG: alpha/beta fold hydrolase [Syntrophomonadaceae bacterium]|nr:alpha/beta fold hydrolase [Syntrophomonadaceae bacterium]
MMSYIYPQAQPFFLRGSQETALLFIHGFTASPSELYPTALLIHDLSACTVSAPLLPGHGSSPRFLNQSNWEQWYNEVRKELDFLMENHRRVFVGGLSLGGLLALHAGSLIKGLQGAISINVPIFNRSPLLTVASPLIGHIRPYYPKKDRLRMRKLQEEGRYAYNVIPVKAFQSVMNLRNTVMEEADDINLPVLLIQSLQDESVHPRSIYYLQEKIKHTELIELHCSGHIATMGSEKEKIARAIADFMAE